MPHWDAAWPNSRARVHFNWKTISVAAWMTVWNFYFQIFEKAVGKEETILFLMHIQTLVVWNRLPADRKSVGR